MPARMTHHDIADEERPVRDLILAHARSLDALKARGVIRSTKVLADYAEWLAAKALGLTLEAGGAQKGYDAVDPRSGLTYQVKARQVTLPYMQPDLRVSPPYSRESPRAG